MPDYLLENFKQAVPQNFEVNVVSKRVVKAFDYYRFTSKIMFSLNRKLYINILINSRSMPSNA